MSTSNLSLDLLSYLQTLPPVILTRLYHHPPSCLAVYRSLSELSQLYIMRLLFIDIPLPLSDINSWATINNTSHHQEIITHLSKLHIFETIPLPTVQQNGVLLNPSFQTNLKVLICGGGVQSWSVARGSEDKHSRDINYLNSYSDKKWEKILNFMVGGTSSHDRLDSDIAEILQHAGLMSHPTSSSPSYITTLGFQFLLMDTKSQVWYFILQYFNSAQERGLDLIECLQFIFQLSFSTLGKDYSIKGLTQSQLLFMDHLGQFGLVYKRKASSKRYYPTKLVIQMTSGTTASNESNANSSGYIIVETNYRVIAYTDSKLHIAMLALFTQMQYRFPNMAVGTITRESVHQALMHGITAQQIISFLTQHAHFNMLNKKSVLPSTVTDQIRLWEIERNRLQFQEGILYSEFLSASDFDKVKKYAEDLGVLMWCNQGRRLMVIHPSRHDEIRHFWKRQKQSS